MHLWYWPCLRGRSTPCSGSLPATRHWTRRPRPRWSGSAWPSRPSSSWPHWAVWREFGPQVGRVSSLFQPRASSAIYKIKIISNFTNAVSCSSRDHSLMKSPNWDIFDTPPPYICLLSLCHIMPTPSPFSLSHTHTHTHTHTHKHVHTRLKFFAANDRHLAFLQSPKIYNLFGKLCVRLNM